VTEATRLRRRDIHRDHLGRIWLRVAGKPWNVRLPDALGATLERFSASGDPDELLLSLNARQTRSALQATARRAGVERVTVAMFRHSLASAAVQVGVPVTGVSTWLSRRPPSLFGMKGPMEEQWNAEMRTFVDRCLGCAE
jgi:integrase